MVSKVFDRSVIKAPANACLSRHNFQLSINYNKAYFVLNPFMYSQRNGERNFPI